MAAAGLRAAGVDALPGAEKPVLNQPGRSARGVFSPVIMGYYLPSLKLALPLVVEHVERCVEHVAAGVGLADLGLRLMCVVMRRHVCRHGADNSGR